MSSLVSVIVPCYNGERFVGAAIDSVLAQSGNLEVVVVDDGSTDGSREVLGARLTDPRVRVERHETNRGIAAARNTGLAAAQGEFVGFLDQDDCWMPGRLKWQMPALSHLGTDVFAVFSDVSVVDYETREPVPGTDRAAPAVASGTDRFAQLAAFVQRPYANIGATLYRREMIDTVGGFRESVCYGSDDFDLNTRLLERMPHRYVHGKALERREHGGNFTDAERMLPQLLELIDAIAERQPQVSEACRLAKSFRWADVGRARQVQGRSADARAAFNKALELYPQNRRARIARALLPLGPLGERCIRWYGSLRR